MRLSTLLLACGLVAAGCEKEEDPAPPAAAGGAAGAAGSATAETRPLGAARYNIESSPVGQLCEAKFGLTGVGQIDGASLSPVVDQQGGALVSCKVIPNGAGKFVVEASIKTLVDRFEIKGVVDPTKDSELDVDGHSNQAMTTYSSVTSPRCTVSTAPTASEPSLGVKDGEIWGRFYCPEVVINGGANGEPKCALSGPGYLAFKNCATAFF